MKELTRTYGELLSDKRVKSEQNKYESFSRQKNSVLTKYRKVYQAFSDLKTGLERAQSFYSDMKDTVDSLSKNVEAFVGNRRSEGGSLLNAIESAKSAGVGAQSDRDRDRMQDLMARMSMNPTPSPAPFSPAPSGMSRPPPLPQTPSYHGAYNGTQSPQIQQGYQQNASNGQYGMTSPPVQSSYGQAPANGAYGYPPSNPTPQPQHDGYKPSMYGQISPPAHQQYFSPPPNSQYNGYPQAQPGQQPPYPNVPQGFVPPPPPPGGPPQQDYSSQGYAMGPSGPGGYAQDPRRQQQQAPPPQQQKPGSGDPWAGLSAWK